MPQITADEIKKMFAEFSPDEARMHIGSLTSDILKAIDERFLYTANALSQTAALTAAISSTLVSKGICTEAEMEQSIAQARNAIADQLNKDVEDLVKADLENADEIRKRYTDLTSSLTQTSSAPE